jgi:hypothetical protein
MNIMDNLITVLIALPLGIWCVGGIYVYFNYVDVETAQTLNWKQWVLLFIVGGPIIQGCVIMALIFNFFYLILSPFEMIGKYFNRFFHYLGGIETKRTKCPYCDLEPLQSTIRRYGMCGLCHKHGRGYNNQRKLRK